jgi:uncharacterized membrane protein
MSIKPNLFIFYVSLVMATALLITLVISVINLVLDFDERLFFVSITDLILFFGFMFFVCVERPRGKK